jgi:hypothetical protein
MIALSASKSDGFRVYRGRLLAAAVEAMSKFASRERLDCPAARAAANIRPYMRAASPSKGNAHDRSTRLHLPKHRCRLIAKLALRDLAVHGVSVALVAQRSNILSPARISGDCRQAVRTISAPRRRTHMEKSRNRRRSCKYRSVKRGRRRPSSPASSACGKISAATGGGVHTSAGSSRVTANQPSRAAPSAAPASPPLRTTSGRPSAADK